MERQSQYVCTQFHTYWVHTYWHTVGTHPSLCFKLQLKLSDYKKEKKLY